MRASSTSKSSNNFWSKPDSTVEFVDRHRPSPKTGYVLESLLTASRNVNYSTTRGKEISTSVSPVPGH